MRQFSCAYGPFGILLPWTCGGNTTRKFTGDPNREADLKPALFYEARTLSLMLQAWGGGGCTEEPSGALGPDICLELPHFMSSKRDAKIVVAHMRLGLWETKGKTRQKTSDFSETVYRNAPSLGLRGRSRVYSSRYDKTRQRKFPFYICPWRNPTARLCL